MVWLFFLHFHVLLWCPWDFWGSFSVGTEIWGEFHHIYRLIQLELILVEKKIDYLASLNTFSSLPVLNQAFRLNHH